MGAGLEVLGVVFYSALVGFLLFQGIPCRFGASFLAVLDVWYVQCMFD